MVKRRLLLILGVVVVLLTTLIVAVPVSAKGFVHGIAINYEGNIYYFQGAPAGDGWDVPGHYWVQAGPDHLRGKHYNAILPGPGIPWSSTAPDGELLYVVDAIIDTELPEKAAFYKAHGYVHRHELVDTNGDVVEGIYAYLKHTARTSFELTPTGDWKTPGIDYYFIPNW
jgi:hypothetical protein